MMEDRWRATLCEVQQLEQSAQLELCKAKLELSASEERHLLAVMKLREEHHMDSLGVLGIMAGEMEKEKASHGDEMRRVKSHNLALKEQVRALTQIREDEQRQCLKMQEMNVELQQRQTEQEKLLAQRDDVSAQLQEVNRANSRLLEQLTERGQEKDKLQQELEATRKRAHKRKAMLDELAIDVAQEKSRHKEELSDAWLQHEKEVLGVRARYEKELRGLHEDKNRTEEEIRSQLRDEKARTRELESLQQTVEELQAQIQSMEGTKGWFERGLKEAEETAEKSALEHQEQLEQSAQLELCKAKLELSASEERHLLAVMKLREEHHMDSLGVLGIMAGEMEKEKASHGDEMRRVKSHNLALKEQVRALTQMREDEQRQCLKMQEMNVELQQRQTEQEKLLAQRDDVSAQLQEVNRANSRLLEQLTERGQEKDKLQQELEATRKRADKRKAMLDELAIDVAQEKSRHKEELSDAWLQHEKEVLGVRARYEKELRGLHEDKNRTEEEIRSQLRDEKARTRELESLQQTVEELQAQIQSMEAPRDGSSADSKRRRRRQRRVRWSTRSRSRSCSWSRPHSFRGKWRR
ncbi:hypothetical protein AAFF_G00281410 [Aldrovandia affinis]|uniref:Uncharacterized protein n=1 Tax=Aldrovandia affinis TaxID=143900 RepID=A0AAD7R9U4_9TELE|nr:hypothetical protein AAFF_G00281410 [Aldrovandia affinis]